MLSIITLDESDKWDSIVKSFSDYDVYYMSGYTKAFRLNGDGVPTLFYYHDEEIRAINVVMIRDIADDKDFKDKIDSASLFDITTPYGYGGFIIEGTANNSNLKNLDDEYSNFCRSKNIICEFVRFHPIIENSKMNCDIYEVTDLGKTILMNLFSREQIWKGLSSQYRNKISKAIKAGVEIYWGRSPKLIDEFIQIYHTTMNNNNASDYYYFSKEFYRSVLEDLKYNSLIFYALYEQKIISISIIIFGNDNMHYHLSASDIEYQSLAATNLLIYEAACWGSENGYKSFHLGGGLGSKEDTLFQFKKAFNKNSETYFSVGKKIFDQDKYDALVKISARDNHDSEDTHFFPQYRK